MDNILEEDNPNWSRFWSHDPCPENPHEFGECMEERTERDGLQKERGGVGEIG